VTDMQKPSLNGITPDLMFDLIEKEQIVQRNDKKIKRGDPALAELSALVSKFTAEFNFERGGGKRGSELRRRLAGALCVISEVLPPLRGELVEGQQLLTSQVSFVAAHQAYLTVRLLDELDDVVRRIDNAAMLFAPELLGKPIEKWWPYAGPLKERFESGLPGRAVAASYRFVMAVMPLITGDELTFGQVARHFQRKVNGDIAAD
jgi:hypothetical protein